MTLQTACIQCLTKRKTAGMKSFSKAIEVYDKTIYDHLIFGRAFIIIRYSGFSLVWSQHFLIIFSFFTFFFFKKTSIDQ